MDTATYETSLKTAAVGPVPATSPSCPPGPAKLANASTAARDTFRASPAMLPAPSPSTISTKAPMPEPPDSTRVHCTDGGPRQFDHACASLETDEHAHGESLELCGVFYHSIAREDAQHDHNYNRLGRV